MVGGPILPELTDLNPFLEGFSSAIPTWGLELETPEISCSKKKLPVELEVASMDNESSAPKSTPEPNLTPTEHQSLKDFLQKPLAILKEGINSKNAKYVEKIFHRVDRNKDGALQVRPVDLSFLFHFFHVPCSFFFFFSSSIFVFSSLLFDFVFFSHFPFFFFCFVFFCRLTRLFRFMKLHKCSQKFMIL